MRDYNKKCEATTIRADGVVLVNSIKFLDQHHPGASRHPSSAEEGDSTFLFTSSMTRLQ